MPLSHLTRKSLIVKTESELRYLQNLKEIDGKVESIFVIRAAL